MPNNIHMGCGINYKDIKVKAYLTKKKCGYCKSGKEEYGQNKITPKGLCADAFYSLYPYFLGLLYDATFKSNEKEKGLVLKSHCLGAPLSVRLSFNNKKLKPLLNFAERLARFLGMPKDAIDKIMQIEALENKDGCSLLKGDKASVAIADISELCPASFFSLYPLLGAVSKEDNISFSCPDPNTCVTYEVRLAPQISSPAQIERPSLEACAFLPELSKYKLSISRDAVCEERSWQDKEINLEKIMPLGVCPFVFNTAIPYIITLGNGGYFKWRKDKSTVEAQCPGRSNCVSFQIKKDPSNNEAFELEILNVKGECRSSHYAGQKVSLNRKELICLHLFARLFPVLLSLEGSKENENIQEGVELFCPFDRNDSVYLLTKKSA